MAGWLLGSALEPSRRDHPFVRFWAPGRAAASGRPGPWPRPCLAGSRICCHHILDVMQRPRCPSTASYTRLRAVAIQELSTARHVALAGRIPSLTFLGASPPSKPAKKASPQALARTKHSYACKAPSPEDEILLLMLSVPSERAAALSPPREWHGLLGKPPGVWFWACSLAC